MKIKFWEREKEVEARDVPRNERTFHGEPVVVCDKCKCFLYRNDAIKQKSRIAKVDRFFGFMIWPTMESEEKIEKVYLCRRCNPRKATKIK